MKRLKFKIALVIYFISLCVAAKAAKWVLLNRSIIPPPKDFKPGGIVSKPASNEHKIPHGEMVITTKQQPGGELLHFANYGFDFALLPPMLKAPDNLVFESDNPRFFNAVKAEINTGTGDRLKLIQDLDRIRAQFKANTKPI